MTIAKIAQGARTQVAGAAAAMNNLANVTYVTLGTITHNSGGKVPLDCLVELMVTPGTVAGNKQAVLFAQVSLDGVNWTTGPASGITITDEVNLLYIGALPLNSNAVAQRKTFSLAIPSGGILPFATRLILKNDSGAALAAAGHDLYMIDINGDLT